MKERLNDLQNRIAEQGLDAILLTSPFNRQYISGFTGSAGYLLVTGNKARLITDFRYIDQAAEQAPHFEVVKYQAEMLQEVGRQLAELKIQKIGFEKQYVSYSVYQGLANISDQIEWIGIAGIVEEMRMIKTPDEIAIIKQACEIADRSFQHILSLIKPGVTEREVALELEFHMRKQGATATSFETIVASGPRSALPHGVASEKVISAGDLVTLDFGAYYKGYVSDITRTVAVGEPSEQLKQIYRIVLEAQLAGVTHIRAGMTGKEADAICRDIITAAGFGDKFGHSTGHGIGLEVHEGPGLSSKSDVILKPGMVVTVEPGIYISQIGGVRIEDDVVITEDGCEIITQSTKELIIL